MARLPNWLKSEPKSWTVQEINGKSYVVTYVTIRLWHPLFWYELLKIFITGKYPDGTSMR